MDSIATDEDELAKKLLARMKLLEAARGHPTSFGRGFWRGVVNVVSAIAGLMLMAQAVPGEPVPQKWMMLTGGALLVLSVVFRLNSLGSRLDALIQLLDDKGQLAVVDDATTIKEST